MHPEIQTALNNYRVDQNQGNGWSMDAENASYAALKSACDKHGVSVRDALVPQAQEITITGPARVAYGAGYGTPYIFEVFGLGEEIPREVELGRCQSFFPGERVFQIPHGVSVVDHRTAA